MDALTHLLLSFKIALDPINLFLCFCGCLVGTFVGVLPGLGPAASHVFAPSFDLCPEPGAGAHPAFRHLLRSHVWGVDHLHPSQYSRGGRIGRYLPGWVSDGPKRPRRPGPGDRGHRLVCGRDFLRGHAHAPRASRYPASPSSSVPPSSSPFHSSGSPW